TPTGTSDTWATSWQPADFDGNGQNELLAFRRAGDDSVSIRRFAVNESPGLLSGFDNGIGLMTAIRYGTSAGSHYPSPFGHTQIVVTSLRGGTITGGPDTETHYSYSGAAWSSNRTFLGFHTVSTTAGRPGASTPDQRVVTSYEQTNGCAMRPTRTEV